MVDSGTARSCVGGEGVHLPMTEQRIKIRGFSGITQVVPITQPQVLTIGDIQTTAPLLYTPRTPVNLLGRDLLCKLNATILCTPDGIECTFPGMNSQMLLCQVGQEGGNSWFPGRHPAKVMDNLEEDVSRDHACVPRADRQGRTPL